MARRRPSEPGIQADSSAALGHGLNYCPYQMFDSSPVAGVSPQWATLDGLADTRTAWRRLGGGVGMRAGTAREVPRRCSSPNRSFIGPEDDGHRRLRFSVRATVPEGTAQRLGACADRGRGSLRASALVRDNTRSGDHNSRGLSGPPDTVNGWSVNTHRGCLVGSGSRLPPTTSWAVGWISQVVGHLWTSPSRSLPLCAR
jgi:hypothetical protein